MRLHQNNVKQLLRNVFILVWRYATGWTIILIGLIIFGAYRITNNGQPTPDQVVLWQGLGLAVILYGISYLFKKYLGFEDRNVERQIQQALDELREIKAQNVILLDYVTKQSTQMYSENFTDTLWPPDIV